ncbi:MAG: ATP-binding protein [Thermoproteota archaeon]|nr:ATP-binding protein [Thermoproteota archaeon]
MVFGVVLSFYYISRARMLNDVFSLFIGIGFLVSAIIDLLHVIISYVAISDPVFIKYFIPQTWFAGRIFLSTLLAIAIIKYSNLSKWESELYQSEEEQIEQKQANKKLQKKILFYIILLSLFSIGIALASLFLILPASVIDDYSLHRPYEIPPLILFSVALFFFYKKQLYKRKDLFYKGLVGYLTLDIFSQIIMSYSATSFDTAHNIAHVLKDAAYFVNIVALAVSSLQYNVELKKSNDHVRIQNEKLKESGKMQKEFINVAAHELRTPIQPIIGLSDMLVSSNDKGSDNQKMAEVIYRNAKKLQRLAEDILDVSKIESNTLNLKVEKFNICDLVSSTISDFENGGIRGVGELLPSVKIIYKAKGQPINYDPVIVEADKTRISQVLSNLLSNANKSSIGGAEESIKFIRIDLKRLGEDGDGLRYQKTNHRHEKQRFVIVSVRDQGSGISTELRKKLFEKFATGSYGGTGLGLFISKNIIESHGGKLWFEDNEDGKGVTFYFTLPIVNEQPLKSIDYFHIPKGQKNITIKKNILSKIDHHDHSKYNDIKKILLVDDDLDINITLKKVLEDNGYIVNAFSNPLDALKEYKRNTYNLLILDIKMPHMSGFELYGEIRKMDNKVKVCFLTAGEISPDNNREIIVNNLFLRKPIENEALLEAIENIREP